MPGSHMATARGARIRPLMRLLVLALVAASLAGCGPGSEGPAGGPVSSGAPEVSTPRLEADEEDQAAYEEWLRQQEVAADLAAQSAGM